MTTKGLQHSPETKLKQSESHTQLIPSQLIEKAQEYLLSVQTNPKLLPTISGLALHLHINRQYLYEKAQEIPELSDIMEEVKLRQEEYALTRGISNQANPVFAMFLLKSKHDYRDNPQQLTQNNYMNISPDVLADAMKLMKENKNPSDKLG
jgi:hypothetical protein